MIAIPYIVALSMFTGAAGGGALAWWAQGTRIERLQLLTERYEASARLASQIAQNEATAARDRISALESDLAQAHKQTEKVYVETVKEVQVTASPTRQCLSPATRRVLERGAGGGADSPRASPEVALGLAPRTTPDPSGSFGSSERAVAMWMASALKQYSALRSQHKALADVVRTLPCVQVTP